MKLLFLSDYISPVTIQAVCRTLLHSLWQGLLAAAVAGIIILSTKRSKAAIRYNLLSLVFISFIACSVITFLKQPGILHSIDSNPIVRFSSSVYQLTKETNYNQWMPSLEKEKLYQPVVHYADKYAVWITGLWLLFFVIHLLRTVAGLHYINRIRNYQVMEPGSEWKQRLSEMKNRLGISKAVGFMESGIVKIPLVVGTIKPMILIPVGMISHLSTEQVETILMHELAHIRRKDFIVNLLQRFAEAFFFFNPFILWISARIREEREACCDDIVMKYTADKRSYLEALVSFRQPGAQAYGPAMALGKSNNLLYRVKRMITQENKKLNAMEKLTLILVLMAFSALSFMPAGKIVSKKKENNRQAISQPQTEKQIPTPTVTDKRFQESGAKRSQDTLPEKKPLQFENISSNIDDDGTIKKEEVTAKTKDGKIYSYRLINNKLVEISVNNAKIKEEDFGRYRGVIDQIERAHRKTAEESLEDQKRNAEELMEKQTLLNKELIELQNKQNLLQLNDLNKAIKEQQAANNDALALSLMQNKLLLEKQNNANLLNLQLENQGLLDDKLKLRDKAHLDLLEQKNKLALLNNGKFDLKNNFIFTQDEKFHGSNYELSQIITELGDAGVVKDEKNFSFTLDNNELIVDGKKQAADLHDSLRNKHIRHKKDYFKYKAKENSRSTDIYVE